MIRILNRTKGIWYNGRFLYPNLHTLRSLHHPVINWKLKTNTPGFMIPMTFKIFRNVFSGYDPFLLYNAF